MQPPELPDNEAQRLEAVHQLHILDTPSHNAFDRLTQLASELFDVPIALVSLVDSYRQWFKSHLGLNASETPRCVLSYRFEQANTRRYRNIQARHAACHWNLNQVIASFTR